MEQTEQVQLGFHTRLFAAVEVCVEHSTQNWRITTDIIVVVSIFGKWHLLRTWHDLVRVRFVKLIFFSPFAALTKGGHTIMNSQVWNTQMEKTRRRKPRSFLYCTVISSKKLSSSLHTATSICARRRHAFCSRFDPCTPKSTKPVKLLRGTISTAVLVADASWFLREPASSSG